MVLPSDHFSDDASEERDAQHASDSSVDHRSGQIERVISWILGAVGLSDTSQEVDDACTSENLLSITEIVKHEKGDVLERGKEALRHLEETKRSLLQEFGDVSLGFIFRHIDPVLMASQKLFDSIAVSSSSEESSDILEGAVDVVELYAIMSDHSHLKKRILRHIRDSVSQAVKKDFQVIMAYYADSIEELQHIDPHLADEIGGEINRQIESVLEKLNSLTNSLAMEYDIKEAFSWRCDVDLARHGLIALCTHIIDIGTARAHFLSWYEHGNMSQQEDCFYDRVPRCLFQFQVNENLSAMLFWTGITAFFNEVSVYGSSTEDVFAQLVREYSEKFRALLRQVFSSVPSTMFEMNAYMEQAENLRRPLLEMLYKQEPPGLF